MLRTAFGAFDAVLIRSAAPGNVTRDVVGKQVWMSRTSAKAPVVPWHQRALMSQLRATRPTGARPNFAHTRAPLFKPRRPFHSTRPRRADTPAKGGDAAPEQSLSFSARLKKLSKEYGWSAVGVYLALSVLDFPFCFLLVRTVGSEKIAHVEDIVVRNVQKVIPERIQTWWREYRHAAREMRRERTGDTGEHEVIGHGVAEAEQRSRQEGASLATQLALAYAIHKSFIFVRVPLTAAITPKVVKVLRSWGWQIGKATKR